MLSLPLSMTWKPIASSYDSFLMDAYIWAFQYLKGTLFSVSHYTISPTLIAFHTLILAVLFLAEWWLEGTVGVRGILNLHPYLLNYIMHLLKIIKNNLITFMQGADPATIQGQQGNTLYLKI